MHLNQFNSLFELFAAFNIAYALSDSFNKDLNERVTSGFRTARFRIEEISTELAVATETLLDLKTFKEGTLNSGPKIEAARIAHGGFLDRFKVIRKDVEEDIRTAGLSHSFKYLCFFHALYCLFMLFILGFLSTQGKNEPYNDRYIDQTIWWILMGSFIFITHCFIRDRGGFRGPEHEVGYRKTALAFIATFIFSYLVYLYNWKLVLKPWHPDWFHLSLIILSLLAPVSHFIYYSGKAVVNSQFKGGKMSKDLKAFHQEYQRFHKAQVDPLINLHMAIEEIREQK
jgi:hypothetical protein